MNHIENKPPVAPEKAEASVPKHFQKLLRSLLVGVVAFTLAGTGERNEQPPTIEVPSPVTAEAAVENFVMPEYYEEDEIEAHPKEPHTELPTPEYSTYTVRLGDTLSNIADMYGYIVDDFNKQGMVAIAEANDMNITDELDIGQVLRIPAHMGPNIHDFGNK